MSSAATQSNILPVAVWGVGSIIGRFATFVMA